MRYRMTAALLSLGGVFLALYLYLHKLGLVGELACGTGGCDTVQFSPYARLLGIDVPLIGVAGYAALLAAALASVERPSDPRWPRLLFWLALGGVAFTGYLTWVELAVLHIVCRWCVGSAAIIVLILLCAWLDRRASRISA